jgi:hypothetical protein
MVASGGAVMEQICTRTQISVCLAPDFGTKKKAVLIDLD